VIFILYTDKRLPKESKSHGFDTTNERQRTKLPELAIFNFGELGFIFTGCFLKSFKQLGGESKAFKDCGRQIQSIWAKRFLFLPACGGLLGGETKELLVLVFRRAERSRNYPTSPARREQEDTMTNKVNNRCFDCHSVLHRIANIKHKLSLVVNGVFLIFSSY
jgi:hypothetical protein